VIVFLAAILAVKMKRENNPYYVVKKESALTGGKLGNKDVVLPSRQN